MSRHLDRFMTVGRLNYLKKLFQYLKQNQSEDCLYLNVYSPERKTGGAIRELRLKLALYASAAIVKKTKLLILLLEIKPCG